MVQKALTDGGNILRIRHDSKLRASLGEIIKFAKKNLTINEYQNIQGLVDYFERSFPMKTGLRNIPDGCFEKLSDEKSRDLLGNKQWLIQESGRKNEYIVTQNRRGQLQHLIIKQNMRGQWGVEGKGKTHPNINVFLKSIGLHHESQILPTEA